MCSFEDTEILLLFDIDGTLVEEHCKITSSMHKFLKYIRTRANIGIVTNLTQKVAEDRLGESILELFDYCFFENGIVAYSHGNMVHNTNIALELGEDRIQKFIDFCLSYISELRLPVKRGTFIKFKSGKLIISPVGYDCTKEEQIEFNVYNHEHKILEHFISVLSKEFSDYDLCYRISYTAGFEVYPKGWDKTYCLRHIPIDEYDHIHFFGCKIMPKDYNHEIYNSPLIHGHYIFGPDDTKKLVGNILSELLYPKSD